jgi:hypothetical protein
VSALLKRVRAALIIRLTSGVAISQSTAENAVDELLAQHLEAIADSIEAGVPPHVTLADFVRGLGKEGA